MNCKEEIINDQLQDQQMISDIVSQLIMQE